MALSIFLIIASIGLIMYKDKIITRTTDDKFDDDYEIDSQPPPNSTKELTDDETLQNILNYQGLDKNPNRLAVCILSNNDDSHTKYLNIDDILGTDFELDAFLAMDNLNPSFSPFHNITTVDNNPMFADCDNKNYNVFSIKQNFNTKILIANDNEILSVESWVEHYIYFNKKLKITPLAKNYSTAINNNTYFYTVFEIQKLNKENSYNLNYVLNIVLTRVKQEDEEELKQKLKNAIYVLAFVEVEKKTVYKHIDDNYKAILTQEIPEIPEVKYTNNIIKTGDHNSYRTKGKYAKLDKRNIKYMLLYINKD